MSRIQFIFYVSICVEYDNILKRVTDHDMHGYSATTSKSIRHYLEALWDHDYITHRDTVAHLLHAFRSGGKSYLDWLAYIDEEHTKWYPVD